MMTEDEMLLKLQQSLTKHRYRHSLGVVQTAVELAQVYGCDMDKCHLAALLHDCAKSMSREDMLACIRRAGIELYPGEEENTALLHAPAGMVVAKELYQVTDKEVLLAIRRHTLGAQNMTLLDKIIYTADFIEPNRDTFDGLNEVRQIVKEDLDRACVLCKELTRQYCKANGKEPLSI